MHSSALSPSSGGSGRGVGGESDRSTTPTNALLTGLQSIVTWGKHQTARNIKKSSPSANINTVDDAKRVERELAGEYDDNDQFFRRHLQQLHFSHLPFSRVAQRIQASSATLDRLAKYAKCTLSAHESAVRHEHLRRTSLAEARDGEFPGSLLDALARLTQVAHKNEEAELEMAKDVKTGLVEQLKLLNKAHSVHSGALISKHAGLVKGLQHANARHTHVRETLRVAVRDRDVARRRWERAMHQYAVVAASIDSADDSALNLANSANAASMAASSMAVDQAKTVWLQKDAAVSRLQEQVKQDSVRLRQLRVNSRLEAEAVALEAQGAEQHRIDALKISLTQHMRAQLNRLDKQRAVIQHALSQLELDVDSSFDARLYSHVCVVEDYLSGASASTDVVALGVGLGGNNRMAAADSMLVLEGDDEERAMLTDVEDADDDDDHDDSDDFLSTCENAGVEGEEEIASCGGAGGATNGSIALSQPSSASVEHQHQHVRCQNEMIDDDSAKVSGADRKQKQQQRQQQRKADSVAAKSATTTAGAAIQMQITETPNKTPNDEVDDYLKWIWTQDTAADISLLSISSSSLSSASPSSIPRMCNLLDQASARRHLLRSLNLYRTTREPVQNGFDDLVVLIVALLDKCYVHSDVKTAKMTSIMSETFYCFASKTDETGTPNTTTTTATTQKKDHNTALTSTHTTTPHTTTTPEKPNGGGNAKSTTAVESNNQHYDREQLVDSLPAQLPTASNDNTETTTTTTTAITTPTNMTAKLTPGENATHERPVCVQTKKIYVQDRIKTHAIWQSPYFWAEAIFFSIREEVQNNMPRVALPLLRILADVRRWTLEQEEEGHRYVEEARRQDSEGAGGVQARRAPARQSPVESLSASEKERLHTYQQIWFCQIGSYSFNMQSFDVPAPIVRAFVRRMCAVNCLSDQVTASLLAGINVADTPVGSRSKNE